MEKLDQLKALHQRAVKDLFTKIDLPKISKFDPPEVTLHRMSGYTNSVYRAETPDISFIVKFPKALKEGQRPFQPPQIQLIVEEVIRSNNFGAKLYYKDKNCLVEEYLIAEQLSIEEILEQDTRILSLFPLAKFSKMKVSEDQRLKLNHNKCWMSLVLDSGFMDELLSAKNILKNEGSENVNEDKIQKMLDVIENVESPGSLFNQIRANLDSRYENQILSHNDFYNLNILRNLENQEKLVLVDFEFSCYNVIGWDITNMVCENLVIYDSAQNIYNFAPENIPKTKNLEEIMKAFLVLRSDYNIQEQGKEFIKRLREGAYDNLVDVEQVDTFLGEFYRICYLTNYWAIFWCIWKAVSTGTDFNLDSYLRAKLQVDEWLLDKIN